MICSYCQNTVESNKSNCSNCGMPILDEQSDFLETGTKLNNNRYSIGRVLGQGGFGITLGLTHRKHIKAKIGNGL